MTCKSRVFYTYSSINMSGVIACVTSSKFKMFFTRPRRFPTKRFCRPRRWNTTLCYFLFCARQRKLARRKKPAQYAFFFLANVTLYFRPVYAMTPTVQRNNVNCYCWTASEKPYPRRNDRPVRDRFARIDPTRPAKIGRQQVSYAGLRAAEWLLIFSVFFFPHENRAVRFFFLTKRAQCCAIFSTIGRWRIDTGTFDNSYAKTARRTDA